MSFFEKLRKAKKNKLELSNKDWGAFSGTEGELVVDVYETNGNLVVMSPIAGINLEKLDVSIDDNLLIVKGEREKPESQTEARKYLHQECYWGPFSKRIILPESIDQLRIKAEVKEGILTIIIPKVQETGKRQIEVVKEM